MSFERHLIYVCVAPFLLSFREYRQYLDGAIAGSCADDIGMALGRLEVIVLFFRLFGGFRLVPFLALAEFILLVSVCATSRWNVDMIRAFLGRVVLHWTRTSIRDTAK